MAAVEFYLPTLPPSKNRLRKRTRKGIARTEEYEAWLKDAGWEIKRQGVRSIKGPYRLSIQAVRPDKKRRDLGNLLEASEDLLEHMRVIENDCMSELITLRWVTTIEAGVVIRVETAGVE